MNVAHKCHQSKEYINLSLMKYSLDVSHVDKHGTADYLQGNVVTSKMTAEIFLHNKHIWLPSFQLMMQKPLSLVFS